MTLRVGSLCSGVGMLDLAVESVLPGAQLAWYAQYEPPDKDGKPDRNQYAAQIMAHRFPGVPNHGDITAIDYAAVEPVDLLTAGWPCQDMSLAGKRAGLMPGTRSGLWIHVARAIEALRPSLVLLENVRSLTSARAHCDLEFCPGCMGAAGGGTDTVRPLRALGCVLGDLADLGFDAEWQVLAASDVGAPHRRERCFVLAWPADGCSRGSRWASSADAHREPREQRRIAGSGEAEGGRTRADARGRGGAPAADAPCGRHGDAGPGVGGVPAAALAGRATAVADSPFDGVERGRDSRGRRHGSAHGGLAIVSPSVARGVAPDAAGDGRGEGGAEPARLVGRPDAAERGGEAAADTHIIGDLDRELPAGRNAVFGRIRPDTGRRSQAPADSHCSGRGTHERDDAARKPDAYGRGDGCFDWDATDYGEAVRRWEAVLGRAAPWPVDDRGRLAQRLTEWMMGLPDGWVTAVPGIARNAQAKCLGNGVVPLQAAAAFRMLLDRSPLGARDDCLGRAA